MGSGYQPEAWQSLYTMLGGSLAALAGLLFVAMSLHLEAIMRTPVLRMRSIVNTIGMVLGITGTGAVLVPQPVFALGIEIVILSGFGFLLPAWIVARLILIGTPKRIPKRAGVSVLIFSIAIAGGVLLMFGLTAGMYLVTIHYFANIAFFFFNYWTVMTGSDEKEILAKSIGTGGNGVAT